MASKKQKMLEMMGLRVGDLLRTCFQTGGGRITRQEFQMFWQQVLQPAESTNFLVQILDVLKNTLEKKSISAGVSAGSLVNTIIFSILNMQINPQHPGVKEFMKTWKKTRDAMIKAFPPIREVMRTVQLITDGSELIGPLMISCSTLHSQEVFELMNNPLEFTSFSDDDILSGENCFIYHYLSHQADDPTVRQSILTHNLAKMLTLPQQIKLNPKVAQTSLLALLHMFNHFLAKGPVDPAFVKRALTTIQQFFMWPVPYGSAARQLLDNLQSELLAPGHTQRQKHSRQGRGVDRGQTYHFFTDQDSKNSLGFLVTMDAIEYREKRKSTRKDPRLTIPVLAQVLLLMSSIHHEPGVGLSPQELEHFQKISLEDAARLYEMFHDEFLENVPKNASQAKEKRVATLLKIKGELQKISPSSTPAQYPPQVNSIFAPPDQDVEHIALMLNLAYTHDKQESIKLMGLKSMPFPSTSLLEGYSQLLAHYSNAKRTEKHILPIVVMGGDRLLHCFLCAHMRVLQTEPHLLKGLDVRFYVVPTDENHLACFIARYDAWYNRHIYLPFRQNNFLLPWVRTEGGGLNDSKEGRMQSLPGNFCRECIFNYVHESKHRWEVSVWQVEAWKDVKGLVTLEQSEPVVRAGGDTKVETKTQSVATEAKVSDDEKNIVADMCIPFIQHFEMGATPQMYDYLDRKGRERSTGNLEDIMKEKDFTFSPPNVHVAFTKVDMNGRTQKVQVEENIQYESIVCTNIPKRKDNRPFPADPTSAWLECYAKPRNVGSKRNILVAEPRQHVVQMTVTSVDGTAFDFVCDGQIFRGVERVKVSRVYTVKDEPKSMIWHNVEHPNKQPDQGVYFPVETFFPLDLSS